MPRGESSKDKAKGKAPAEAGPSSPKKSKNKDKDKDKGKGKAPVVVPADELGPKDLLKARFGHLSEAQKQEWVKRAHDFNVEPKHPLFKLVPKSIRSEYEAQLQQAELQQAEAEAAAAEAYADWHFKATHLVHDTTVRPEILQDFSKRYTVDPDVYALSHQEAVAKAERSKKRQEERLRRAEQGAQIGKPAEEKDFVVPIQLLVADVPIEEEEEEEDGKEVKDEAAVEPKK